MLMLGGAADMASAAFRMSMLQSAADDAVRGRLQGVFIVVVAGGPRVADALRGAAAAGGRDGGGGGRWRRAGGGRDGRGGPAGAGVRALPGHAAGAPPERLTRPHIRFCPVATGQQPV